MRIVVTTTQGIAGIVEKKTQTINISPFDTTPKSLIDDKGDLLVGLSAGTLGKLSLGTDGNVLLADSTQTEGIKWGPSPSAGGTFECYNNDGVTHALGTVVIVDPSVDYGVKKTTSDGDPKVMAVAVEAVSAASSGDYAQTGLLEVLVQGNVSRGMWLVCSTTSGRARAAGYIKPTSGGIGIAQTEYAGGAAGSVYALVDIDLNSTAPLQRLTTKSTSTSSTISHTTDPGTDLLIVCVMASGTTPPTTITWNGTGLTKHIDSGNIDASIWYLRNPTIGTYSIVISGGTVWGVEATNYAGTQSSPLRTGAVQAGTSGSVTTRTISPSSAAGDIVIDLLVDDTSNDFAPTGGQTQLSAFAGGSTAYMRTSYLAGSAGSTTMSWAGSTNTYITLVGCAIAGS
jgi:hypothetical protein